MKEIRYVITRVVHKKHIVPYELYYSIDRAPKTWWSSDLSEALHYKSLDVLAHQSNSSELQEHNDLFIKTILI